MCDSTEGNGKAEIVMDYVMSWSLRHAVTNKDSEKTPQLHLYCRYMLGKLLDLAYEDIRTVESVKVWKEWQNIDLCVEAIVETQKGKKHFALLIENKYYSKLHDNQLQRYKAVFEAYYKNKNSKIKERKDKWLLRYKLVSCYDRKKQLKELYAEGLKDTSFKGLTFYQLLCPDCWEKNKEKYKDSESEIFNEFWLRRW